MKKKLFVGFIAVVVIGLLSSKAGLLAGSVYMVIWAVVLIMATYDYFLVKSTCERIEQALDVKEKCLSEIKMRTSELKMNQDKLSIMLESEGLSEENQEKTKTYIEILGKIQLSLEEMISYLEQYQRNVTLQTDVMASFLARVSKSYIKIYQKRQYPFNYQPSERVLAVINNQ